MRVFLIEFVKCGHGYALQCGPRQASRKPGVSRAGMGGATIAAGSITLMPKLLFELATAFLDKQLPFAEIAWLPEGAEMMTAFEGSRA